MIWQAYFSFSSGFGFGFYFFLFCVSTRLQSVETFTSAMHIAISRGEGTSRAIILKTSGRLCFVSFRPTSVKTAHDLVYHNLSLT
jgi:hypothetical protein